MRLFYITYILLCFSFQYSNSQNLNYRFDHLSTDQGLSDYYTECILADSYGYIWVGTKDGLNCYNGYSFNSYKTIPNDYESLLGYIVYSIIEDSHKRIWIGTHYGGLSLYNREKDCFERIKLSDKIKPDEIILREIAEIEDGILALATQKGLCIYNHNTKNYKWYFYNDSKENASILDIKSLCIDKNKNIWIGTENYNGLHVLIHDNISQNYNYSDFTWLNGKVINSLNLINDSCIWIGVRNLGLYSINTRTKSIAQVDFQHLPFNLNEQTIYTINKIKNNIFLGLENNGLIIYNTQTNQSENYKHSINNKFSITSNSISDICIDKQDNIWLSSHDNGIYIINKRKNIFNNFEAGKEKGKLNNNIVSCFLEDSIGNLWIGTDGGGLNYLNRKTNEISQFASNFETNATLHLSSPNNNNLYISSWNGGITQFNITKQEFIPFNNLVVNPLDIRNYNVKSTLIYGDSILINTHFDGIYILQRSTKKLITIDNNYPPNKFHFLSHGNIIIKDSYNDLWNATSQGLYWINKDTVVAFINSSDNPKGISNSYISTIYEDSNKRLWIATGSGLDIFNRNDSSFINLNEKYNINYKINAIIEDNNGNIWLSSNKGLIFINPENSHTRIFTKEDGLPSNQFVERSVLKTSKGELIFGSIEGFTIFHPDSLKLSTYNPPIYITDFKIFNESQNYKTNNKILSKSISATKSITLSYKQNYLEFNFVAIDHIASKKILYSYILEGFDKDWIYKGHSREAHYTNIPPGNYIFKVKSTNSDGVWCNNIISLDIIIKPPFWQTWWFYSCSLIFIISLIILIFQIRLSRIKKTNKLLEEKVKIRTEELTIKQSELEEHKEELLINNEKLIETIQTKDRFFSIIAHDLKNPMNILLGLSELLKLRWNFYDDNKKITMIEAINTSSNQLYNLLENLLEWSRSQTGSIQVKKELFNLYPLINENIVLQKEHANKKGIHLVHLNEPNELKIFADKNMIDTVIRNIISNAIKFTNTNGIIEIFYKSNNNYIKINIKDNGVGMSPNQLENIFKVDKNISTSGTDKEKGTGLGLLVCKDFITINNGTIDIISSEGKGTTFIISLPSNS